MDDPKVNVVKTVSHQQRGVVLLTVLNATAEDSGLFWCVANNGIGGKEVRNATYLLVRRESLSFDYHRLQPFHDVGYCRPVSRAGPGQAREANSR